ncbi:Uma2 family endonuclease [Nostoc sp. FACHB-87]|uniref:Uma2 family endonuclease n=1 Tax=Nostocales TaxID=1161 RepID=UPI001682BC78|nr:MULTISPECIES: Uma2 family endonuclease [Nostocales]MBD2299177.1 Uma2 family endonuclease [Nostoc sp. FACHB-190]MBD2454594.1 Uma2 family endonuclease [Nostoc sp. FACHB-87]MBD2476361.1 Uma2 family endonuclease [Anabaena sp. FACHB-83]MBD2488306.1 Uma2 family endonuclease [Aulosira sp. FACHB-615]
MGEQLLVKDIDNCDIPDANLLITEDDTPVDNLASEKQQRLLVSSLYSSLQNQVFLAAANVGVYHTYTEPAIVPDVFVSFDVQTPENWWEKENRCYLVWKFGKSPELVIEIVSNKKGNELDEKLQIYEKMRVAYYIVYDPQQNLGEQVLRIYTIKGRRYLETTNNWLEDIGLGVTLWTGEFEGRNDSWLRWCDQAGNILLTGDERARQAEQRAQEAEQRAQLLAERLKALGVDPDSI